MKDNQGATDTTQIDHLAFIGSPAISTNMAEFKRVRMRSTEESSLSGLCVNDIQRVMGQPK